jgi:4-hydroxy-2-oxoheptanedioate aldolase
MGPIKNEDQNELWLQIETHGALGILEEVASTDGVTGLFVGPGDLSLSLGRPGEWGNPALWESIEQVFQETKKHQKKFGIFVADPAQVKHWEQSGADVVVIGSDTLFLLQGYTDFLKKVGRQ